MFNISQFFINKLHIIIKYYTNIEASQSIHGKRKMILNFKEYYGIFYSKLDQFVY